MNELKEFAKGFEDLGKGALMAAGFVGVAVISPYAIAAATVLKAAQAIKETYKKSKVDDKNDEQYEKGKIEKVED